MKIIFMGTPEFAVPSLAILVENKYDIVAVVTVPDRKKGRGLKTSFSEVKEFALTNDLNILQPDKLKDKKFIDEIRNLKPDIIIVVAFRILPIEIFSIPNFGSFNLHASLLPKYRGAAPVNWAIINGETETGVTSFFLQEKVDTGNIIIQRKIEISKSDDAGSLHNKLAAIGADVVLETVKQIENKNILLSIQNNDLATPAPKIFREDCKINWNTEAYKIHNLIRGLSPYPAAFTTIENRNIKIYNSSLTDIKTDFPTGRIIIDNKKLLVSTVDFLIQINELQAEGKKRLKAEDFINGLDKNKKYDLK